MDPDLNIGIIIQARMGSTRLPGKVLKLIGDRPLLSHILDRLEALRHSAAVVVATSSHSRDNAIDEFCAERRVDCFRGSEEDVLERYYQCATQYKMNPVVRLTADNPFVDIDELDRLLDFHLSSGADYTHSFNALPVGVGCEVFTLSALETSFNEGHAPNHREHVNEFIQEHPERFRIVSLTPVDSKNRPELRLTVDTEDDFRKACFIAEHASSFPVSTEEAITLCSRFA